MLVNNRNNSTGFNNRFWSATPHSPVKYGVAVMNEPVVAFCCERSAVYVLN